MVSVLLVVNVSFRPVRGEVENSILFKHYTATQLFGCQMSMKYHLDVFKFQCSIISYQKI